MPENIWVFLETEKDEINKVSLETLSLGRKMADDNSLTLTALLASVNETLTDIAGQYGADQILCPDEPGLMQNDVESLLNWTGELLASSRPAAILMGVSPLSRETAPRLSARFEFSLLTECVDLKLEKGILSGRRPVLNGKAQASVTGADGKIQIATVKSGAFDAKKAAGARVPVVCRAPLPAARNNMVKHLDYIKGDPAAIDLAEAEVIIAVGKGIKDIENMSMIEELAEVLGASLGGTRGAVDLKLIRPDRQIGMTGKSVSPRLFISCGISGQYPHTVGMDGSETIIVINTDKDAPMFKLAALGIAGRLEEVIPALINRVKSGISASLEAAR